jgi:glucosyltransferase GtrII-like protein
MSLAQRLGALEQGVIDRLAPALMRVWHRERGVITGLGVVALLCFGFELFNFNFSIDEELHAAGIIRPDEWLAQGRWGMYLLTRFLLPFPVTPVVPVAVALVSYVASITLLLAAWGVGSPLARLLAGSMAIAFPGLAFIFTFSTMNFGVGIGFLLLSIGALLITRPSRGELLLGAVAFGGALSIYQAFAFAAVSAAGFAVVLAMIQRSEGGTTRAVPANRLALRWLSALIAGACLYAVAQKALLAMSGRRIGYVTGYWDAAFLIDQPWTVLSRMASSVWAVYMGTSEIYVEPLAPLGWLVGISVLLALAAAVRLPGTWVSRLTMLLALAVALVAPFALNLTYKGMTLPRTLLGVPIALCGLVLVGWRSTPRGFRVLLAILVAVTVLRFSVATNRLLNAGQLGLLADRALAAQLVERIEALGAKAGGPRIQALELVGFHEWPKSPLFFKIETLGGSFFEWEQGNGYRVRPFLATMGAGVLGPARPEQMASVVQAALGMPVWPDPGSVENVDGVAVVKLGPYSDQQRRDICRRYGLPGFCPDRPAALTSGKELARPAGTDGRGIGKSP